MNPSTLCSWRSLLLHMATVVLATHNLELDTRQVLSAVTPHEHNMVLLQAVALSGEKAGGLAACAAPHMAVLSVG